MASNNEMLNKIVRILDSKKGMDIVVLDVRELTTITEYFVIVTGGSDTQVKALCDNLEEEIEKDGVFRLNKEGYRKGDWVLLGYEDVIVHIFLSETRNFYDLEHVWQDAKRIDMSDIITE
ncbi:MAG: ribosome silencing factor [Oscillospiraceae bacterium]